MMPVFQGMPDVVGHDRYPFLLRRRICGAQTDDQCRRLDQNTKKVACAFITMKRYLNLFSVVASFDNLLLAARKAARCKRKSPGLLDFFAHFEDEVWLLHDTLQDRTWRPGGYHTFIITSPKQRLISAAPFRDRVVHHALINVIGPLLERSMIDDSYANRAGKGTHRAIARYQHYLRRFRYVLKCDIRKFFPSVDHLLLKSMLHRMIACPDTRWLIDTVIESGNTGENPIDYFAGDDLFSPLERAKGLPIGNLTSQFFANYYLNGFDHFVRESLRCRGYVRYVDDFALFADSKAELWHMKDKVEHYLESIRLRLNPKATALYPSSDGRRFLGHIVFSSHCLLPSLNVRLFRKKLRAMPVPPGEKERSSIAGWLGHARQANTRNLVRSLGINAE
jgi:retron-type reverse transcriptase